MTGLDPDLMAASGSEIIGIGVGMVDIHLLGGGTNPVISQKLRKLKEKSVRMGCALCIFRVDASLDCIYFPPFFFFQEIEELTSHPSGQGIVPKLTTCFCQQRLSNT